MKFPNIAQINDLGFTDRSFLILFIAITIPISIDAYFGNVMDAFTVPLKSIYGIILFSIIILSFIIVINVVFRIPTLTLVKTNPMHKDINKITKSAKAIQYILIFLILFILFQIYFISNFYTYINSFSKYYKLWFCCLYWHFPCIQTFVMVQI